MTQFDKYFAAGAPEDAEREQLRLLAAAYNDASQKRLKLLGIGDGWRCLEVGPGGGFMTKWLAETVAPNGSVVALDSNVRFVRELRLAGVEAREGEIVEDEIENGGFDLVYSRFVVSHLADPVRALHKMAAALKPGGWLMVEDSDYASYRAADRTHPLSAVFDATVKKGLAYFQAKGAIQPTFGRSMPACVAALDLESIGGEATELRHKGVHSSKLSLYRVTNWWSRAQSLGGKKTGGCERWTIRISNTSRSSTSPVARNQHPFSLLLPALYVSSRPCGCRNGWALEHPARQAQDLND